MLNILLISKRLDADSGIGDGKLAPNKWTCEDAVPSSLTRAAHFSLAEKGFRAISRGSEIAGKRVS